MTTSRQLEWVRAPQQARSQETLERLLDAAEAVLAEKSVESASVAEIAKRAGSSVGAFYARFHDKEGLLNYLFQRFDEQAEATARAALEPPRWEGVPLRQALEAMLRFMVSVLHEKRGLIAAMISRMPSTPALGLLGERLLSRVSALVVGLVRTRGATVRHPDSERAVYTAVWLVFGALELRAVASMHATPRLSDQEAASDLAEMCVRYLGIADATPKATAAAKRPPTRPRTKTRSAPTVRHPTEIL